MFMAVTRGVLLPFLGTTLGAACVFFMKKSLHPLLQRALSGFSAGVMVAASVWSLLIPAINQAGQMGKLAFIPAVVGFWFGILFLLLDHIVPHLHMNGKGGEEEGAKSHLKKTMMLVLAVTLHNIPEGMAVGIAYAGWMTQNNGMTAAGAFALALGIAIQNIPEGAIISMPLKAAGVSKKKAFFCGALSGTVEPISALVTIWAASYIVTMMPYFLSFAAGFTIMMILDVALG